MNIRYFLQLILLFVFCGTATAGSYNNVISYYNAAGSGESYSDIVFYWGMENDTAEKSAGDSGATYNSAAVLNTDYYMVGAKSLDCLGGYDHAEFDLVSDDITDTTSGRVGFYLYVEAWVSNKFWEATYDANNRIQFYTTVPTARVIYEGTGTQKTFDSTWTPSLDTWYFIEIIWGGPTYTLEVKVDGVSKNTTTDSLGTMVTNSGGLLRFGNIDGNASDVHIDQMIISTDPTRDLYILRNNTSFPD